MESPQHPLHEAKLLGLSVSQIGIPPGLQPPHAFDLPRWGMGVYPSLVHLSCEAPQIPSHHLFPIILLEHGLHHVMDDASNPPWEADAGAHNPTSTEMILKIPPPGAAVVG